jgi:hypothetical protein
MAITNPSRQQHLDSGSQGSPYVNFFVFSVMPGQVSPYEGDDIGERTGGSLGVLNNVWTTPGVLRPREREVKDRERQAREEAQREQSRRYEEKRRAELIQEEERMRKMRENEIRAAFSAAATDKGFSLAVTDQLFEFYTAVQGFLGPRQPNEEDLCEAIGAANSEADVKAVLRELIFKRCIDLSGYPDIYQQIKAEEAEEQLDKLDSTLDKIFGN